MGGDDEGEIVIRIYYRKNPFLIKTQVNITLFYLNLKMLV